MPRLSGDSTTTNDLLEQARAGHAGALGQLLLRHRRYLRQLVELRLDPRVRRRVDPSDVVQEAQVEAVRRLPDYLAEPPMSFRLWLRQITFDRLLMLRRRHADAQRRAVSREAPLPEASTLELGRKLCRRGSTPSEVLIGGELARRVREALAQLPEDDRELLLMRNYEGLSNLEIAEALAIEPATASKRYGRALLKLRTQLIENGLRESEA